MIWRGPWLESENSFHFHQQGIISVTITLEKANFEIIPSRVGLGHNTFNGLDVPKIHDLHIEEMYFVTSNQMHKELKGVRHRQPSPNIIILAIWMPSKIIVDLSISNLPKTTTHLNNITIVFTHA
jgi:hypothetical protein